MGTDQERSKSQQKDASQQEQRDQAPGKQHGDEEVQDTDRQRADEKPANQ